MNKTLKNKIIKRCEEMNRNFNYDNIKCEDFIKFGDRIKKARYELLEAEIIASKIFKRNNDEYKIVEELLTLVEEYRNQMDNKPVEVVLRGFEDSVKNSVFYGPIMDDNIHLKSFLNEWEYEEYV